MGRIELVKAANEWGSPDRSALYTDDFQFTNALGGPPMDRNAWLGMADLMESAIPDISTVFEDIREEGDSLLVTSHWEGTFTNDFDLSALGLGVIPATGKVVVFPTSTVRMTFDGDKLCAVYDPATGPDAGMAGFLRALSANGR